MRFKMCIAQYWRVSGISFVSELVFTSEDVRNYEVWLMLAGTATPLTWQSRPTISPSFYVMFQ